MKVLLLEKHVTPKLASSLGGGGHVVSLAKDEKAAMAALSGGGFQLLLVVLRGADAPVAGLVEAVRKADFKAIYVVIVAQESAEEFLVRLLEAGADLCLRGPIGAPLLLAQLRSVERAAAAMSLGAGGAGAGGATPLEQVSRSATWRMAEPKVQEVAGKFLSMEVVLGEAESVNKPLAHACAISLSSVEHQLEVRIAVAAEAACGTQLAVHMFGPECAELVPDVLSELSNILMGMLKTGFSSESMTFTGGLPAVLETAQVLRPLALYAYNRAFALRIGEGAVLIHLSVRSKANQFLVLGNLREGMVLAKDVFNARGLLMVHGGTRLSMNMIEKMVGALPPKTQLEVVAP